MFYSFFITTWNALIPILLVYPFEETCALRHKMHFLLPGKVYVYYFLPGYCMLWKWWSCRETKMYTIVSYFGYVKLIGKVSNTNSSYEKFSFMVNEVVWWILFFFSFFFKLFFWIPGLKCMTLRNFQVKEVFPTVRDAQLYQNLTPSSNHSTEHWKAMSTSRICWRFFYPLWQMESSICSTLFRSQINWKTAWAKVNAWPSVGQCFFERFYEIYNFLYLL